MPLIKRMSWNVAAEHVLVRLQKRNPGTGLKHLKSALLPISLSALLHFTAPVNEYKLQRRRSLGFCGWAEYPSHHIFRWNTFFFWRGTCDCAYNWSCEFLSCSACWLALYNGCHVWISLHCCGFHTHESLSMLHMTAELSRLTCPVFNREAYLSL